MDQIALSEGLSGRHLRQQAVTELAKIEGYDWCGIYRLEGNDLVLDSFVGSDTEHTRISVGRGVCGTAVMDEANQIVEDVDAVENYLSCNPNVRSEIVVLIRRKGEILGQIDIDSHVPARFNEQDEALLMRLAAALADRWE